MPEEGILQKTGKHPAILIVDDDEINRSILRNLFDESYPVEEAANGEDGLVKILWDPDRYCAILLDVVMPQLDGLSVLEQLAARELPQRVPIFLITADDNDRVTREAYRLGVMDVIHKPIVPYVVDKRVRSVIELFETRKQLSGVVESQQYELLRQAEKILELNRGMIEALATAIEFRDAESGQHVNRIHDITHMLLSRTSLGAGLSHETIDTIALGAIMHDIGKIAIPDAILNKPGKLTREEFAIMQGHTVLGARLLEQIPPLRESMLFPYAYDIARHHHERWDGGGYPDGLKGDEITIWSQVTSIADVYDALSCKRVYKDAFPHERVVEMIVGGECGVFGPRLLEAFLSVEDQLRRLYDKR